MTDEDRMVLRVVLPAMRRLPERARGIQVDAQRVRDVLAQRVARLRAAYAGNGDVVLQDYIAGLEAAIADLDVSLQEMAALVEETRGHAHVAGLVEGLLQDAGLLGGEDGRWVGA